MGLSMFVYGNYVNGSLTIVAIEDLGNFTKSGRNFIFFVSFFTIFAILGINEECAEFYLKYRKKI